MRFMLLMKGDPPKDPVHGPGGQEWNEEFVGEIVAAMNAYAGELRAAGVLLAEAGLYPSWASRGVLFSSGQVPRVVDGPFSESKEVIAGFYLIEVSSEEEALEWAKRCPIDRALAPGLETVFEVRRVADVDDTMTADQATEVVWGTITN
jgi:hypothetical protein